MFRHRLALALILAAVGATAIPSIALAALGSEALPLSAESKSCITCHSSMQPNLTMGWERGLHARKGVGCFECHRANASEPDAIPDHNGFVISTIVSPNDCGKCHPDQAESFKGSFHAQAGRLLYDPQKVDQFKGSDGDVVLGKLVQGQASFLNGCEACHGTKVAMNAQTHTPTVSTWPNLGVGRINPDGSVGACSACHQRHDFRMDSVRAATTCGRCHLGPDHPQLEVWQESKHGIAFDTANDHVDLNQRPLMLGRQKQVAPTCVTCHLGATNSPDVKQTHDPGMRSVWRLSPEVSTRNADWIDRRLRMGTVCMKCHSPGLVKAQLGLYDKSITLYNNKFAIPAQEILEKLRKAGKLDAAPFNEQIERIWLSLWHHEGRRARVGSAMLGADHVQWHGFFEVAQNFYFKFLPEAERLLPGVTGDLRARPEHAWIDATTNDPQQLQKFIGASRHFWETETPEPAEPATKK